MTAQVRTERRISFGRRGHHSWLPPNELFSCMYCHHQPADERSTWIWNQENLMEVKFLRQHMGLQPLARLDEAYCKVYTSYKAQARQHLVRPKQSKVWAEKTSGKAWHLKCRVKPLHAINYYHYYNVHLYMNRWTLKFILQCKYFVNRLSSQLAN